LPGTSQKNIVSLERFYMSMKDRTLATSTRNLSQWLDIDRKALVYNLLQFRRLVGRKIRILAVVKANAYGHGLREVSGIVAGAGADWLGVNSVEEGVDLRKAGMSVPILVLGAVLRGRLEDVLRHDLRLTVYNVETVDELARLARKWKTKARVHLKVETGTQRQGVRPEDLSRLALRIAGLPGLVLEGLSSHFANIEDTTSTDYPELQLRNFQSSIDKLRHHNIEIPVKHMSCTASSILFPATYFDMIRIGIGLYGIWPSKETLLSCRLQNRRPLMLKPVLSWRARIAQLKKVPKGSYVGYGCTYRTTRATRLAVIPVGYSDGYNRSLSNSAYVLIRGHRAAVRGRVAMNFITADVTDIPAARLEDEVTLIGNDGRETLTAEYLASISATIPYEILARISPFIPRLVR
jgi:alanine racemase